MTSAAPVAFDVEASAELFEEGSARGYRRRGWLVRRALLTADVVGLLAAFITTEAVVPGQGSPVNAVSATGEYLMFFATLPIWVVAAKLYGLYDRDEERTNHSTADDFAGVFQLMTINIWLVRVAAYLVGFGHPDFRKLLVFWMLAITFVPLGRATGRAVCRRHPGYTQNTLIVGLDELSQGLAERIARHPEYGLNVVGFVSADEDREGFVLGRVLGGVEDLPQLVSRFEVERVVVASDSHGDADFIRDLNDTGVQVDVVPRFHEVISGDIDIHMVEGIPVIGVRGFDLSRSSALMKRGMDIVGASVGLIILSPLFALVALAIKLDSAGPVFFRQVRAGARGQQFHIMKFRTMRNDAEERKREFAHLSKHSTDRARTMFKITDDPRITRVGMLLRRSSIDELPQLWNVLRGEMSLVGPRPLILEEHAQVRDWETKRLGLRPGMTGLWQVLGRDEIPFVEMVRLDYVYVTSWSLGGDFRLLLRTLPVLIRGI